DDPDIPETQTWNLLYRLEFPWVGRLNDILVEQLFTSPDAPDHFGVIAPGAENKLDPGLYERLAPLAEKRKGSREFRHLVTTLEYRYTMRKELMWLSPPPQCGVPTPSRPTPTTSPPSPQSTTAPARPVGNCPPGPSPSTSSAPPSTTAPKSPPNTWDPAVSSKSPSPPSPPTAPSC